LVGGDEILGFDEAGGGPLLVAIHGFPFDRRMWAHQLEGLAGLRRVIAVDLPGRGASLGVSAGAATIDGYADHVAATIASFAPGPGPGQGGGADVVGLSMGGYVAFALWRRHPEVIRSLVLSGTRAATDSAEGKRARNTNADLVRSEGTIGLAESMLPKLLSPATGEGVRTQVLRMFEDTPAMTAVADLLAMRDREDSSPTLARITVPVLIVRGADDAIMGPGEVALLAGGIRGAAMASIPGAGHLAPLENPDSFNAAVRTFLTRLPSP
jgi:3-oxoadipate enol-lactonase